ncbi:probable G-protein coupled receptor 139 [Hypanus sabinus]|uniref:probable G-protein coupled receptor 139 n=1 Tax=Hypanus sabinus TaxID=79690 RepID=UPI0028C426CD|nr:probable G-protein coupled receptor 139 [Hypanus sabinus]
MLEIQATHTKCWWNAAGQAASTGRSAVDVSDRYPSSGLTERKDLNLAAIVILSRGKCGLSNCITRYLVGMAAADLIVVVIAIIVEDINNLYVYARFLHITPVCALTLLLKIASLDCSVWLTVAFTLDRCVAICCQNLRKLYCTEGVATVVIVIVGVVGFVRSIPFYFVVEPYVIINNVPWRCVPIPE